MKINHQSNSKYLSHFHLDAEPFQRAADPRFIWLGEKYSEALATLEYGIQQDKGFLLLTGGEGVGKTFMINVLLSRLDKGIIPLTIAEPVSDCLDFFSILSRESKMSRKFDSKGDFLIHFKTFLHTTNSQDKKIVLIIDDAQNMSNELLEEIRLLSNIELEDAKLINILFVGRENFNTTLTQDSNFALRQGIGIRYHLDLLNIIETYAYIEHRLETAGSNGEIFTSKAVGRIHFFSKGSPRLINDICDCALKKGYLSRVEKIDAIEIDDCVQDLDLLVESGDEELQVIEYIENDEQSISLSHKEKRLNWIRFGLAVTILCLLGIGALVVYSVYFNQSLSSTITKDAYQHYKRFEKHIEHVKKDPSLAAEEPRSELLNKEKIQERIQVEKEI